MLKLSAYIFSFFLVFIIASCSGNSGESGSKNIVSSPLSEQKASESTLFISHPSDYTGITFTNPVKPEHRKPYLDFGSGVAIADFDNDGMPDIYLTSIDGPNKLYRQVSPFKFEDVTDRAGVSVDGTISKGATFADIDNDGDLDLYVSNLDSANLLFINNGNGTFTEGARQAGIDHDDSTVMSSFSDYDRDGDLDLYVLTYRQLSFLEEFNGKVKAYQQPDGSLALHPDMLGHINLIYDKSFVEAGKKDHLYRNNGDGTFTEVTDEAGISGYDLGLSVQWWDYNHDGWPDIYVANDLMTPDHLYHNNGDGTFTDVIKQVTTHTPWNSMGSDFADINNDGMFDLLVGDMSNTTHYKEKTSMGHMGRNKWFLEVAEPREYMRNSLYLNTGTNRFMEVAFLAGLASTDWTWSVKLADFDNDGLVDAFFTNGHSREESNPDNQFLKQELMDQGVPEGEAFKQMNVNLPPLAEKNLAFRNKGNLEFEDVSSSWGVDHMGVSHGAALADLDNDGDLDIVVNNLHEEASVYENHSSGRNRVVIKLKGRDSNKFGVGSTVELKTPDSTQVKMLQPVRGYASQDEPVLHFGLGDDAKINTLTIKWPSGAQQQFKDLDVNNKYTITEPVGEHISSPASSFENELPGAMFEPVAKDMGLDFRHREKEFDDYQRESLLPYKLSRLGPGLAVADVNGDGAEDTYVGGGAGQAGRLYLSNTINEVGQLTRYELTTGPWAKHSKSEDMAALFFDANGDAHLDLYVVSGSNEFDEGDPRYMDRLYLGEGEGRFKDAPRGLLPENYDSGSTVAASDYDGDGDLDLFVGSRSIPGKYPLVPDSRLYQNTDGVFSDVTDTAAPGLKGAGLVNGAVWSDIDSDGDSDLVLAIEWGPVTIYMNESGKLINHTQESGLESELGLWNAVTAGDIDNDGDMDIVAANLGLNTKYHTDKENPMGLYFADFDDSGTIDLVETEYEHGTEYPIRGRSCSTEAMPFVGEKFETFGEFASASVVDIYTDDSLFKAGHNYANNLESSVFLNDGNGVFTQVPLPRLAQSSPGYGVVLSDFNTDGYLDIYMNQNFFGPQPETGFFDGGLGIVLLNNKEGSFKPLWPRESGIIVPEDATAASVTDFDMDGRADLLIATNNDYVKAYRNTGTNTRKPQVLKLEGPRGNLQAVGASVLVTRTDGTKQLHEVTSGSGYLSQSTTDIFLGSDQAVSIEQIEITWPGGEDIKIRENLDNSVITVTREDVNKTGPP